MVLLCERFCYRVNATYFTEITLLIKKIHFFSVLVNFHPLLTITSSLLYKGGPCQTLTEQILRKRQKILLHLFQKPSLTTTLRESSISKISMSSVRRPYRVATYSPHDGQEGMDDKSLLLN